MPALRRAPHLSGALVTPSTRRTPRSADSREWRKSAHEAERLADPIKDGGVPQRFAAIRGRTTGKSWAHVRDSATASPSRASRCVEAKCSRKRDALVSIGPRRRAKRRQRWLPSTPTVVGPCAHCTVGADNRLSTADRGDFRGVLRDSTASPRIGPRIRSTLLSPPFLGPILDLT